MTWVAIRIPFVMGRHFCKNKTKVKDRKNHQIKMMLVEGNNIIINANCFILMNVVILNINNVYLTKKSKFLYMPLEYAECDTQPLMVYNINRS